ncbi:MAG: DUF1844 domain-containing protein [Candidatus Poribacteria bacterium]|nr:DUF1844 domain-containing protein [Candidatus Poribacteria bacterium]
MEDNTTQEETQLPSVDFISFITDLVTTTHLYLQGFKDPETDNVIINLGLAKRMIDTIEMLEEKTKGNLSAPESNFLANSLYDLRMGYVRAVNSQKDSPEQDLAAPEEEREDDVSNEDNRTPELEETTNEE